MSKIWSCKIGETETTTHRADGPMRRAVADEYINLTGRNPTFIFSGWGAQLTEAERAVVENREPRFSEQQANLGLATTKQLLVELERRVTMQDMANAGKVSNYIPPSHKV